MSETRIIQATDDDMKEAVREVLAEGGHGALSAPAQDTQFEPDEGCGYIVLDEVADHP